MRKRNTFKSTNIAEAKSFRVYVFRGVQFGWK